MRKCMEALLLLLLTNLCFAKTLEPFHAQYALSIRGIQLGMASSQLTIHHHHYDYLFKAKALLPFVNVEQIEESKGMMAKTIRPEEYHRTYKKPGDDETNIIHFHHQRKEINGIHENQSWKLALSPETLQDNLSYQLALQLDLLNGKKHLVYDIAREGKKHHYIFTVVGHDRLRTPAGVFDTVHLQQNSTNKNKQIDFWVAPDEHFQLVKILKTKHGKMQFMAVLSTLNPS